MFNDREHVAERDKLYDGYPEHPPFEPYEDENMYWHYDCELNVGCWIINDYNKPMLVPKTYKEAIKYPGDNFKYKSPIPLHDMQLPNVYRGRLVWYIDEKGFGKYYFYVRYSLDDGSQKGKLSHISVSQNVYK